MYYYCMRHEEPVLFVVPEQVKTPDRAECPLCDGVLIDEPADE